MNTVSMNTVSMNTDYAALALVVDRSGSMASIATDVVGSVRQFIGDQKKIGGKASLTVAQFDHQYELIHDFKDINEVDEEKFAKEYFPRGMTALLDAIGRTMKVLSERIESLPIADKPKRVVVAVITDGLENSSTEYNLNQIKEMIQRNEALGWDFMFLGATLNAVEVAKTMGFSENKAAVYDVKNVDCGMKLLCEQTLQARHGQEIKILQDQRDALVATGKS